MLTRIQKEALVQRIAQDLRTAKSAVFVNYSGFSVKDLFDLRQQLFENQVTMRIIKKRLLKLALAAAGISEVAVDQFEGPVALILSFEDEAAGARLFQKARQGSKSAFFYGAVLEKNFMDGETAKAFALLPGKQELRGKLVGVLQAPLYGLRYVLEANQRALLLVLSQAAKV